MIEQIDIIITTKNRLTELIYTVDHMLSIGFKESQFYITDDCSTDGTFEKISMLYPNINIRGNPSGKTFVENRSDMMEWSNNFYILSIDDDSHIRTKEDIEEAISILSSNPAYGIFHFRVFNQIAPPPPKNQLKNNFRTLRGYVGCGHIIKREVIIINGRYRKELVFYFEELDYSIRAYKQGYKVVGKDDLVVHHRIDTALRIKQVSTVSNSGVFGREWRNINLYSNNLIITLIYYPYGIGFLFILYRLFLAFKFMVLKEKQFFAFFKMLGRFFSFVPYCIKEMNKLSYKEFRVWFAYPDFTDANSD